MKMVTGIRLFAGRSATLLIWVVFYWLGLGGNSPVFTQYFQEEVQAFYDIVSSATEISRQEWCDWQELQEIDKTFFKGGEAKIDPVFEGNWQVIFEYKLDGEHVVGQSDSKDISSPIRVPGREKYCMHHLGEIFSSKELKKGFQIELDLRESTYRNLKAYPGIRERDDPLNSEWVPIRSGDQLVLRYVYSYPDGNMTSRYREFRFYFRRVG